MNRSLHVVALVALGLMPLAVRAQGTAGKVSRIDKTQQRITLRHEAIRNLDMPAMSMVFRVKDPAMLEAVKEGDVVHFDAEKVNGQFVITRIGP